MLKCYTYNQQNLPFQSVRRVFGTWGRDEDTRSVAAACATRPAPPPPVEFMFMRTAREADASAGGGMVRGAAIIVTIITAVVILPNVFAFPCFNQTDAKRESRPAA